MGFEHFLILAFLATAFALRMLLKADTGGVVKGAAQKGIANWLLRKLK